MSLKSTVSRQYQKIVNRAAARFDKATRLPPPEGWIATVRKALGMSGAQLARRMGVTRARVSRMEHDEAEGAVTLKTMMAAAEAMQCRFVYAVVPDGQIQQIILAQAHKKAEAIVRRASSHMALESQALPAKQNEEEIEHLAEEFIRTMPSDLWAEK